MYLFDRQASKAVYKSYQISNSCRIHAYVYLVDRQASKAVCKSYQISNSCTIHVYLFDRQASKAGTTIDRFSTPAQKS